MKFDDAMLAVAVAALGAAVWYLMRPSSGSSGAQLVGKVSNGHPLASSFVNQFGVPLDAGGVLQFDP